MKKWKSWQIVAFTAVCLGLNIGGRMLASWLGLPLWLDSLGTALCAYVAGPVVGAMVGVTSNLAFGALSYLPMVYSITGVALGFIVGIAARHRWFEQFYGFMKAASLVMLVAMIVSVPLNFIFVQGYTGNAWGDAVMNYLLDKDWPRLICGVLGQLTIEFPDKLITVAIVYLIVLSRRWRENRGDDAVLRNAAMVLLLGACLSLCVSAPGRAENAPVAT